MGHQLRAGACGLIATALQAGGAFRFQLLWAIVIGTVCVSVLVEMTGRLAAVTRHTLADAVRERFGWNFHVIVLTCQLLLDLLVLTAEVGGVAYALQLASGVSYRWWAVPVAFALWLLLWFGTF